MDVGGRAVIAGQLVVVIHLNRIKWAILGAITTVHANINVNVKIDGFGFGSAVGQLAPLNPNALGGAHLGANAARCTPIFARFLPRRGVIHDQKRNKAEPLGHFQLFLWVHHRDSPFALQALADFQSLFVVITAALPRPFRLIAVGVDKVLERNRQTFEYTKSVHRFSLGGVKGER